MKLGGKKNGAPVSAPWVSIDVGAVGIVGSGTESTAVYTAAGSGTEIGGAACSDQFHYVYQPMSGDGAVTARLASQSGATTSSITGVMIREATATGSRFGMMMHRGSGNNTMRAIYRTTTGGLGTSVSSPSKTLPNSWVRVTRTGNSIAMMTSDDGTTWTTVSMASEVTAGFVVCSGNNGVSDTDTFDNVTLVP